MKKTIYKTTFKETLPKRPGKWPRMEVWQTIPEGFQHVGTGKILTKDQFEIHQLNQDPELVGYVIKAMENAL